MSDRALLLAAFAATTVHAQLGDTQTASGVINAVAIGEPCNPTQTFPGDGIDNDCDGLIDEDLATPIHDADATPPDCAFTALNPGPPTFIEITTHK